MQHVSLNTNHTLKGRKTPVFGWLKKPLWINKENALHFFQVMKNYNFNLIMLRIKYVIKFHAELLQFSLRYALRTCDKFFTVN